MNYITSFLMISLILICSCNSENADTSSETSELDENELTRVSLLIDPAPKTYQEDQVNKLVQYALDHKWPVHKTNSGLLYWIRDKGNENRAQSDDTVMVRYKGNLLDGKVFDQSPQSGEPVRFKLSEVIPAWQEALSLIGEDGKITILAHSDLGYKGQRIGNVIPPYSPLIFEIELLGF